MSAALAPLRFAEVLRVARLRNASDVHLACGMAPVFRVDGVLEADAAPAPAADEMMAMTAALLDGKELARLETRGDVTVTYRDSQGGNVRVHAYRTHGGPALALRLLAHVVPTLESLGLPAVVETFAQRAHGMVIFAGPTGSGKSTAMAAMIDEINSTKAKHIMAIEDPIEYVHSPKRSIVTHREIGSHVETFADAIYGALRSDPDVLLVGEMRDASTMHAALTAAETGHLVLTTLHTGDAAQTVDRIAGSFSGHVQEQMRLQLSQTLIAVVCMRLVPLACGSGRRSACEILIANDAVRNLIREGKSHLIRNVLITSRRLGMQSLEAHLSDLVASGEISADAAKAATGEPADIPPGGCGLG